MLPSGCGLRGAAPSIPSPFKPESVLNARSCSTNWPTTLDEPHSPPCKGGVDATFSYWRSHTSLQRRGLRSIRTLRRFFTASGLFPLVFYRVDAFAAGTVVII